MVDKFFEKGRHEDEMFNYLIDEIKNCKVTRAKAKYHEAFKAFGEKYLDNEAEQNLIGALMDFETDKWSINSFNPIRKIIESIYKSLHYFDDNLIPYSCVRFEKDHINIAWCERRLKGQAINNMSSGEIIHHAIDSVLPKHLNLLITETTKICSIASHPGYRKHVTKNTLGYCLFFVMDLLIWYKNFIDDNYLD